MNIYHLQKQQLFINLENAKSLNAGVAVRYTPQNNVCDITNSQYNVKDYWRALLKHPSEKNIKTNKQRLTNAKYCPRKLLRSA